MKRGLAAPFLFLSLVLTAKGSADASPLLWSGAVLALFAAALILPAGVLRRPTWLQFAVYGFAFWLIATNLWANPSYTAAAPFNAALLVGGFLFGRRAGMNGRRTVFATGLVFAAILALWALWQQVAGVARSHAVFETPATLAVCINLILVPGLLLLAMRRCPQTLSPVLAVLAAALLASASRGGWVAFAVSVALAVGLLRLGDHPLTVQGLAAVGATLAGGILLLWAAGVVREWGGSIAVEAYSVVGPQAAASSRERLALYQLAWQAVTSSSPVLGLGYLGFYYVVEGANPALGGYTSTPFYFVHNDYLQTLLELGIPGLLALLLLAVLPLTTAWRDRREVPGVDRVTIIAIAAATLAMTLHALVDFPFYIPTCLLMYGIALGLLDSMGAAASATAVPSPRPPLQRAFAAAGATLFVWTLFRPAAAEACALRASQQWRAAHAQDAALWYELARRMDPADWRYHWYAGQFWFTQARAAPSAAAADRADAAFAAGVAANPREVKNLLGRLATQRRMHDVLSAPADERTLRNWASRAIRLAPHDPSVRAALAALDVQPQEAK